MRSEELGAVFGTKNGWERPDYFEPGRLWRRAGEDQRTFGWTAPPYLDRLAEEHRAVRERVGIFDFTSFGKLEVSGPGALALLERVCDARIDRPVGRIVYTQFLNSDGGIVADLTVTRLDEARFRLITGAAAVDSDRGWLELHADGNVEIRDVSDELAVIGIWGPRARDVLTAVTGHDVSGESLPFSHAREIAVGPATTLAQRITFVGELGFELYVAPAWAVQVWDRLMAAGREHGIRAGGYRVLESLRIEKGYRYFGTDLTGSDTPHEGGVGFCVAADKDFIGAAALAGVEPRHRLRTVVLRGDEYRCVYGGEAVRIDGAIVGRVRTGAYAFTLNRMVTLATVPTEVAVGTSVTVDVLGEPFEASVAPDVLYDPHDERIRAG